MGNFIERFFVAPTGSFFIFGPGDILNLRNMARECSVTGKSAENKVSILENLLLGYQLPVFTKHAKRTMIAQSEFYLFDAGVYYRWNSVLACGRFPAPAQTE